MNVRSHILLAVSLFLFAVLFGFCDGLRARAEHQVFLPFLPTAFQREFTENEEILWCANSTALSYPNFKTQLEDVHAAYARELGITFVQVSWGTPSSTGCQIQHNMLMTNFCSSCAAHVFYTAWPVVVEYKGTLGYFDWRTTQGHENGHAILGLHEQYIDSVSPSRCDTTRTDTVMSCGTGVRYPQEWDIENGCTVDGLDGLDGCQPASCPCWDGRFWTMADGWKYEPATGEWYTPEGTAWWSACTFWKGRRHLPTGVEVHQLTPLFYGRWATAPGC